MAERLHHRGPDARGEQRWPSAFLGHTRLKIIDLSESGAQPMTTSERRVWVAFNGEIYNHHELRAWLRELGHDLSGRCDTEVIPHLYQELGPRFVERLRGMFAIAVFDVDSQELHLYRDRFGIKPLFYATSGEQLAFASEIGALRRVPWVDFTADPQAVYDFVGLRYVPAPSTFFTGVRCLEPGTMLSAKLGSDRLEWRVESYHRWTVATDRSLNADDVVRRTGQLVEASVKRQLEADVSLGSFLSGGIDSSLISLFARKHRPKLRTFNLRFPDATYDETDAALSVAATIESRHTVLEMETAARQWEDVKSLLLACGQPFADTSVFGLNAVCQLARQHVTVALSGDGGDEGFAGYNAYGALLKIARLRSLSGPVTRLGGKPLSSLAKSLRYDQMLDGRISAATCLDETALVQRQFWAMSEASARELCSFVPELPTKRHFERQWKLQGPLPKKRSDRLQLLATEANIRMSLANDYLPKADIASMSESLELRVPMLDEELIDFALSLPWQMKVSTKDGKIPLRRLASELLPAQVARKPKHGFGVPLDMWMAPSLKRELVAMMLKPSTPLSQVFRPEVFRPWLEAFAAGRQVPGLRRPELHVRIAILLSVFLFLAESEP